MLALGELDAVSDRADLGAFQRAVRTVLEEAVLDASELPGGGFGDGVFVAPFNRARGLRFDRVVVLGLADAVVPGGIGDDALLPEDIRRSDTSGALRTRAVRLDDMRADVLAAIGAGTTRRVGTYPHVDPRNGRAQVPSRWMGPSPLSGPGGDRWTRSAPGSPRPPHRSRGASSSSTTWSAWRPTVAIRPGPRWR